MVWKRNKGLMSKVAVGTTTSGVVGSASHTAYVTYLRVEEALRAIQVLVLFEIFMLIFFFYIGCAKCSG